MSDLPPPNNPTPPPQGDQQPYAQYYRPGDTPIYGTVERLRALSDGYFQLNWVFLVNIVLAVSLNAYVRSSPQETTEDQMRVLSTFTAGAAIGGIVIAILTFGPNKKIAFGKDWSSGGAILASILMGLNSALCCGLLGYVIMQQIAGSEMKKYGIKTGIGLKKKDIEARIAEMQSNPSVPKPGWA